MTIEEAGKIANEARSCFGTKTTNKVYSSDKKSESVSWDKMTAETTSMYLEEMRSDLSADRQKELHKFVKRNEAQLSSSELQMRTKNPRVGTPYERGKKMYESNAKDFATGNCGEQSAVAAYRAMVTDSASSLATYLVTVTSPGDHVFCLVGTVVPPSWTKVSEMKNAAATLIVIDPWMHFACRASDYPARAGEKMDKWLKAGKRIYWSGNDGKKPGWYQPGGDYVARFLDSKLTYEYGGGLTL